MGAAKGHQGQWRNGSDTAAEVRRGHVVAGQVVTWQKDLSLTMPAESPSGSGVAQSKGHLGEPRCK